MMPPGVRMWDAWSMTMKSRPFTALAAIILGLATAGTAEAQMLFKPVDWSARPAGETLAAALPA